MADEKNKQTANETRQVRGRFKSRIITTNINLVETYLKWQRDLHGTAGDNPQP